MMKARMDRRLFMVGFVALLFCFATLAEAVAQGAHASRDSRQMQDVIDVVNTVRGTLTIGDETFVVSESSRLFDARGGRIRLGQLRGSRTAGRGDMVEYSIRGGAKGAPREIRRLSVVEGDYE